MASQQPTSYSRTGLLERHVCGPDQPRNPVHSAGEIPGEPTKAVQPHLFTGKGKTALLHTNKIDIARESNKPQHMNLKWRPATPGDMDAIINLTPREREVILLLSEAASNRDIGRSLGITERTVKAHLTHIMTKIKVTSRTEAALFAYAHHQRIAACGEPCPT